MDAEYTDLPASGSASLTVKPGTAPNCCQSENFNGADFASEQMFDVVASFEQLHQSIPWLSKAGVSSECHRGQLQILQAAIDYIIDLEEQLTDQLTGDFYRAALQQSFAAAAAAASVRRPFADVNSATNAETPAQQQMILLNRQQQRRLLAAPFLAKFSNLSKVCRQGVCRVDPHQVVNCSENR
uniref:BHLH domain-containing protein n=1 Tax=Macrostomum lignano TaxID=282301 RepID=A0A1I8HL09_9PLAT